MAGVTRRFNGMEAVSGIDLEIPTGSVVGVIGPSGSGKTTTIRMITGSLAPTAGKVEVLGEDPSRFRRRTREQMGYMPQLFSLYPDLTVSENIDFSASLYGLVLWRRWRRKKAALELVDLWSVRSRRAANLSGGMKRRLSVARSLINQPDLMLLDEPTTGLDPQARHMVWDRLYRLKQRGVTLVLTTHYMDEAEQLCDRLVVMDKAKIVAEGSPRQLIERYSTREVTEMRFDPAVQDSLGDELDGLAERVERLPDRVLLYTDDGEAAAVAAHERGLRPETVLVRRSTLEDVFLRLTGRSLIE